MTATTTEYDHQDLDLPIIRKLDEGAPSRWLSAGIEDLKLSRLHSLIYGLVFTLAGIILIWQGSSHPLFVMFTLSAFVLAGPLAAVGLYDISRRIEQSQTPSLLSAISALKNNTMKLILFALILGVSLVIWTVITGSVVNTFFSDSELVRGSWTAITGSSQSMPLVALFMLSGLVLALLATAISVISIPMASRRGADILTAGLILLILIIAWSQLTAMVFGLFFDNSQLVAGSWSIFFQDTRFLPFIGVFIFFGALLAAFVFTISVITIPYITDRNVSIWMAISTSIRAILKNPGVMVRWAATLALLQIIGMGFFFIGLVLTLPLAGHASWHAYRDIVIEE